MGGTGVYTEDIIRHLLSLQTVKRWQLGRCDFRYQFQYSWEKEDLLNALFSIPKCFDSDYHWTYDTDSYPWTINLVRADDARNCEVRYGRNEQSIKRGRDISNLCTRLYCMGSGEGVNQTSIRTVNPTGKSYIDSPNISKYGVISKLLTDSSISDEATLFAKGKAYLRELENPMYSYTVKALDFYRVTGLEWDLIDEGKLVRLNDTRAKLDLDKRIVSVEKSDVEGNPLDMTVEIATQSSDVSSTLESISAKTAITAQYAQGATNLYAMQASDTADASHPAVMNFYVPTACAKINQVLLSWKLENFRAYETGAAAGGGDVRTTQEGGGSTQTSEAGGATTVSVPQRTVAQAITSGTPMQDGTVNANTSFAKSIDGGNVSDTGSSSGTTGAGGGGNTGVSRNEGGAMTSTDEAGKHSHGSNNTHRHTFDGVSVGKVGYTSYNGAGSTTSTGAHSHGMGHWHSFDSHTHSIGSHKHDMTHRHDFSHYHMVNVAVTVPAVSVDIPNHTHKVNIPAHSHSFTLQSHTHEIRYGIYEGEIASGVTIKVDGTAIPPEKVSGSEIDVIPYLSKDNNGRIVRGMWHEVSVVPDKLTRIQADLFVQTFVTSYTGGNY